MPQKPRTERQKEAARQNGRRSRGPKTEAGKTASSRNAIKHGICASSAHLLPHESEAEWRELHDAAVRRFRPADLQEYQRVSQLASLQWRMHRGTDYATRAIHAPSLQAAPDDHSPADRDALNTRRDLRNPHSVLGALSRLEAHCHRTWERTARDLLFLQNLRRHAEQHPETTADAAWSRFLQTPPEPEPGMPRKLQNEPGEALPNSLQTVGTQHLLPLPGYQPRNELPGVPNVPSPSGNDSRLLDRVMPVGGNQLPSIAQCQAPGNDRGVDITGPGELPNLPDVLAEHNPALNRLPNPTALQRLLSSATIRGMGRVRNPDPTRPDQVVPLQPPRRPHRNPSASVQNRFPAEPLRVPPVSREKDVEIGP